MMVCFCSQNVRDGIHACLRDYDRLQNLAVVLIYIQIGCSLIGSLGALYNGVSLINLGIALFALVAIESSSQSLGRTYAVLLFCAILLDISWFILFSHDIWNMSSERNGMLFTFSLRLTLAMEIVGFCVRFCSSFLWIQIYRLGISYVNSGANPRDPDFDLRTSFLSHATLPNSRQCSHNDSDDALGASIYDPAYYSSLFEDRQQPSRHSFLFCQSITLFGAFTKLNSYRWRMIQKYFRLSEFKHIFEKHSLVLPLIYVLRLLKFIRQPKIWVGVGFVQLPA